MSEAKRIKRAEQIVEYLIFTKFLLPAGENATSFFGTVANKETWINRISKALSVVENMIEFDKLLNPDDYQGGD